MVTNRLADKKKLLSSLQNLSADPKRKATNVKAQPTANDGETDIAEDVGLGAGAGASDATEVPTREKTVAITAIRGIKVAVE